ncbi:MAG TPA: helix-hairpin-helix domain-containing protein [Prolixibacteraceae bacterium]|nr:helix-hairpin-helix domain-containing protein [Prolixibacteraceae bacterium]
MDKKIINIVLFILIALTGAHGQDPQSSGLSIIERIVESYAEDLSEEADLSAVLEDLEHYIETPLNINTALRTDLEKFPFLTSFQIENLLAYRRKFGQIYSQYELEAIEGFNSQLAADLSSFVSFLPSDVQSKAYWKQEMLLRYSQALEKPAGFKPDKNGAIAFEGMPMRSLLKYRVEKGNRFKLGITAENDAGEAFFKGSNPYGFDFYSGYVGFSGRKALKEVYLGDFQVKTGQGLVQWTSYGKRKMSDGIGVRATGQGIRANTSADENNFMRGVASRFELGNFNVITYYSLNNVDATVSETDSSGNPVMVSSLQTSGYHRTSSEISNKNSLNVQTAGGSVKYTIKRFSIAMNGAWRKYNATINPAWQPYNHYYFRGNENFNLSADALWVFNRINLFGEAAISKSGGKAILAGFESQPASSIAISMIYRDYDANFHSVNGTAFGESSGIRNERGIYAGLLVYPLPKVKISGYIDSYESKWVRYTSTGPVRGNDFALQTDYTPTRKLSFYLRFKTETNSEKSSESAPIKPDEQQQTNRARFNANWIISDQLTLKFRTEWSGYKKNGMMENGWLVFTDIATHPFEKLSAVARFAWFNTESYNSRVYAYENDVPEYFYIPAFNSHGLRYYVNMSYAILQNLKINLKFSQTNYLDDEFTIGSGNTLIEGNKRSELRAQLRYRF